MGEDEENGNDPRNLQRNGSKQSQSDKYQSYRRRSVDYRDDRSVIRNKEHSPKRPTFNIGPSGILDQKHSKGLTPKSNTEKIKKYSEPPEKVTPPKDKYYIFLFNDIYPDGKRVSLNNSFYTLGKADDCDFKIPDPEISQVNTVIQFRKTRGTIKPYVIDLASTAGTKLNDISIPPKRFLELKRSDSIIVGDSSFEFIFMITE